MPTRSRSRLGAAAAATALTVALLAAGCGNSGDTTPANKPAERSKGKAAQTAKENPGRLAELRKECDATTEEGKAVLEKVKAWAPVVNDRPSDKPLREIAAKQVEMGMYEICWSASQRANGHWKVVLNLIDVAGEIRTAEWDYEPATGTIKTFNSLAMQFWDGKL